MMKFLIPLFFILMTVMSDVYAQRENAIYDESKVPSYQLPDVLTRFNGGRVKIQPTVVSSSRE